MRKAAIQNLAVAVDSFISKASKRNEPLESFRNTDEYKAFESYFSAGIRSQADWVASRLDQVHGLDDQVVDEDVIKARLNTLLQSMPGINAYVSETKVTRYFIDAFNYSVEAQLLRLGYRVKADTINFNLQNKQYIAKLRDQANYLLTRSSLDNTTRDQIIAIIQDAKIIDNATIDEMADAISSAFDDISDRRAFVIANTETNQAMSAGQDAFLRENGVPTKIWVTAGSNVCAICEANADDGAIGVNEDFDSGDSHPPAHPNCECYEEGGEIDLSSINIWDGS